MSIFEDLFVLELANNHWGSLERGLRIIREFGSVAQRNGVRAAIKLQFRDVDSFIHKDHLDRTDVRYIRKVVATRLPWEDLGAMVSAVRDNGMITMVTAFDERSVDQAMAFDVQFLKIASSDTRDWRLIRKIAATGRPVLASSGGSSMEDMDRLVGFFAEQAIPFALNHCVSIYPSEDSELELNQIDFLRARYPGITIGFSSHEMSDWRSSVMMAYAKGARTFERHIDIDFQGIPVSPYCTLPEQADAWFKAFHKAKEMCGPPGDRKRVPPVKEVRYLDELVRGVYARRDLQVGETLTNDNIYLAVPLQHGQLSCREFDTGETLRAPLARDKPIRLLDIESDYSNDLTLQRLIEDRGVGPRPTTDDEAPPRQRAVNS